MWKTRWVLKRAAMLWVICGCAAAFGQAGAEFEAATVKVNAPEGGFHWASEQVSGGPGTADPGMFRCSNCSLATLILKAYNLQPWQFPGRKSVAGTTYEVMAKIPAGTSDERFGTMLQNLLKDRWGLAAHFQEKRMKGYRLVTGKNGLKQAAAAGGGESHSHGGVIAFGTSASFRAQQQTMAQLARVLSDQLGVPVEDATGLTGKYDIALQWTADAAAEPHQEGNHAGGAYGGHGRGDSGGGEPGPGLFTALQEQLGLKLVPAEETEARLFVIDRVALRPTEN